MPKLTPAQTKAIVTAFFIFLIAVTKAFGIDIPVAPVI